MRFLPALCAASVALWIVLATEIGPVVLRLGTGHGIHAGDFLAVPLVALAAWSLAPARG